MKLYVLAQELAYETDVKIFELTLNEGDKLFTDYFDDFNDYKYACVSALSSKICGNTIVLNEEQYKRMAVTDVIAYVPNAYEIELAS